MVTPETDDDRRSEFLRTGLVLLAEKGPRVLTAVRLAQELEVTTGSFYWHFDSVTQFHADLMDYWLDPFLTGLVDEAIRQAGPSPGSGDLLRSLSNQVLATNANRYDDAMRAWAQRDDRAEAAVMRADRWRARVMHEMVGSGQRTADETRDRVELMGTVWRGSEGMEDTLRRLNLMRLAANEDPLTDVPASRHAEHRDT